MRTLTFVVGTGRSGSTALSRIVNLHPDVLSLNELLASLGNGALPEHPISGAEFWQLLAAPNPVFETMIRSGLPLPEFLYTRRPGRFSTESTGVPALSLMVLPHLTDDPDKLFDVLAPVVCGWPRRSASEQYEALFEVLCRRFGRKIVIERSGYSVHWVPRLRAAFPQARFVHLFRDGPDCALSMSRHPGYRVITLLREILSRAQVTRLADLTDEHLRSLPDDLTALLAERFDPALVHNRPLSLRRFGDLWSQLVLEGLDHLDRVPAPLRTTLAYEDLLDSPRAELARLAEFAGVEPLPHWLDAGCALLDNSRRGASHRLAPHDLAALRESCGPGTRALRAGR
ncbi:sulfotransferase [Streptomyces roseus]|uniref:sulfotransferase n=1 Tax=Streptomyces TaxID=1883 RepID=UPI0036B79AAD